VQAIVTKYLGPTNVRGARIKAACDAGTVTIPYPHELGGYDVHAAAAMELVRKLGWQGRGKWACGSLPNQAGFVFACTGETWLYDESFRSAP
jgi:hypothetical protein